MRRSLLFAVVWASALPIAAFGVTLRCAGGVEITADSSGGYEVAFEPFDWRFHGALGSPARNLSTREGFDSLGFWQEVAFDFTASVNRHGSMRCYQSEPRVLFTLDWPTAAVNNFHFPSFQQYPQGLDHLSYTGTFSPPVFAWMGHEGPWIFYDSAFHTFILSAARNFMVASTVWGPNGEMQSGVDSSIPSLPGGFSHSVLLQFGRGINLTIDAWGSALTTLGGKARPANDADESLRRIGYWTDAGATYYYGASTGLTYEETLRAVHQEFDRMGIGLGYVQLDSWFYPKGPSAEWTNNGRGIYEYVAAPPLFASGLAAFQASMQVPLVAHARWVDQSSPYRSLYKMSGNVVIDPAYWDATAGYLAAAGVATYEQDWLNDKAQPAFNLTEPDEYLNNMARAMHARGLTMQYCMASPRHFLQATLYGNLTTVRVSADRMARERWTDFLYASRLASAVGAWPFTDNFLSTETYHALLAALSAGPVGIGDPLGEMSAENLLRTARKDGVIVKPDAPLIPIDRSYAAMSRETGEPQIAATHTEHGAIRTAYLFAFTQGANSNARFTLEDLGLYAPAYAYDWFTGTGRVLAPGQTYEMNIERDALYLVVAPLGPSGIAMLGDLSHFVSMGKKRASSFADNGTAEITLEFAGGEAARTITGYSAKAPEAHPLDGSVESLNWDSRTGLFQVVARPAPQGSTARIVLRTQQSGRMRRLPR